MNSTTVNVKTLSESMSEFVMKSAARSAWDKGVKLYALELIESYEDRAGYEGREASNHHELVYWLLNGAVSNKRPPMMIDHWKEYSYGGSALVSDIDIAERLCNNTELKRTHHGEKDPNPGENWLDVQARALYQASRLVKAAYKNCRLFDDNGEPLPRF